MKKIAAVLLLALGLAGQVIAQAPPPVPALPDTQRLTQYSISGTTCACSVGFALYADASGTTDVDNWIQVWINGVQYLSTDATHGWSLSSATGSLGSIARPITDAVLTFNAVQTGTVQILGARRPRRVSQFAENRGVPARDLNQAITDLVAQNREQWDLVNRAIIGQPGEVLNTLPAAATRANGLLGFNASGQPALYANTLGGIIATTCGAHNWFSALSAGGAFTCTQPAFADLSGTPTTLAGYGITNSRTQAISGPFQMFVNGDSGATHTCTDNSGVSSPTCSAGSDSNNCLTPATACLTAQHAVLQMEKLFDLAVFSGEIVLAYNTAGSASALNYGGVSCQAGPWIGQGVVSVTGDSNSPTSVHVTAPNSSYAMATRDLCILSPKYFEVGDQGTAAGAFNATQLSDMDLTGIKYDAFNSSASLWAVSGPGAIINILAGNSIAGNVGFPINAQGGGVVDFNSQTVFVANNLTFTDFAFMTGGALVRGVSNTTFGSPTGITGTRAAMATNATLIGGACNSVFPGNVACTLDTGAQTSSGDAITTAPQTWTPTDASGASLTLTVTDARWYQYGKIVVVTFAITYPTTANGSTATIGGLPLKSFNGTVGVGGGALPFTNVAAATNVLVANNSTQFNFFNSSGGAATNAQMSGGVVRGTIVYLAN